MGACNFYGSRLTVAVGAEYALVRFAYDQGLGFACGGWCGGVAELTQGDVLEREHVRFSDLWERLGC